MTNFRTLCAVALGACALGIPSAAVAAGDTPAKGPKSTPPGQAKSNGADKGANNKPTTPRPATPKPTPTPSRGADQNYAPPKGNAYGFRCRGVSKKRVKGQKGTPFSRCVHALKALDEGKKTSPLKACKGLSKKKPKKVKGSNRRGQSPYAVCVSAGRKLLAEKKRLS